MRVTIEHRDQTIFLMEDFPLPPNLVRTLIKLSDSNLPPLSPSLPLPVMMSVYCLLQLPIILEITLNTTLNPPRVPQPEIIKHK